MDTEIPGSIQRIGETHLPERVPGTLSTPLVSASGELTGSDISGPTQLSYTNQVSHPQQRAEKARARVASRFLRKAWRDANQGRKEIKQRGHPSASSGRGTWA